MRPYLVAALALAMVAAGAGAQTDTLPSAARAGTMRPDPAALAASATASELLAARWRHR